jgi:hypothetical protein
MRSFLVFPALLIASFAFGQDAVTATGGDASGSDGTVAYAIGQVVYTTSTGTNGSSAQGVEQAYEISITTGADETVIELNASAYPNPANDFLLLRIENFEQDKMEYQLLDMEGKLISGGALNSNETQISIGSLPCASYYLKITQQQKEIKSFLIVKK